jgi:hypothetical protein
MRCSRVIVARTRAAHSAAAVGLAVGLGVAVGVGISVALGVGLGLALVVQAERRSAITRKRLSADAGDFLKPE